MDNCTGDDDVDVGEVVFNHFFKVSLHFVSEHIEGSFWIVLLAVVPNQLNVVQHCLDRVVLSPL